MAIVAGSGDLEVISGKRDVVLLSLLSCVAQCRGLHSCGASQPALVWFFSACTRVLPWVVRYGALQSASCMRLCCCANDGTDQRLRESVQSDENTDTGMPRSARMLLLLLVLQLLHLWGYIPS